ncbi:hypothetical protein [Microbacterium hydrocarbonoxydans]|uniref:hypothetical protein n=1 Tax=Microbacterium hydrocarbonoxydans TaxID=273678 RepID=UPI00203C7B2B|nr:hypothetical protein [Microbacterium hydrocarbonoxydans]MCM3780332.1 hypothetical protein [Microbacterium hydrocarbonoxydans]
MLRPRSLELHVDRDSVAMGDDVVSHAGVVSVPRGTVLSAAIERSSPEIESPGWSWVAVVDGVTSAVWSIDHGVQLVVADRKLTRGPVDVFFRYFAQIDPAWLFDRLARGERPDRRALDEEYAPIAREKYRAELRRRERELDGRLLSTACVEALRRLGADITLHADVACEFTHGDDDWVVRRADTMFQVFRGGGGPIASLRPHAFGEAWLVGMVGAAVRAAKGWEALPDAHVSPDLELSRSGERWISSGATVVQVHSELAACVAQLAHGRSVSQMLEVFEV